MFNAPQFSSMRSSRQTTNNMNRVDVGINNRMMPTPVQSRINGNNGRAVSSYAVNFMNTLDIIYGCADEDIQRMQFQLSVSPDWLNPSIFPNIAEVVTKLNNNKLFTADILSHFLKYRHNTNLDRFSVTYMNPNNTIGVNLSNAMIDLGVVPPCVNYNLTTVNGVALLGMVMIEELRAKIKR